MREIKFRAWDKERKCMYSGVQLFQTWQKLWEIGNEYEYCGFHEMIEKSDRFILMQYTGLNDKKGNLIYEGDILKFEQDGGYIVFDGGAFKYVGILRLSMDNKDYSDKPEYIGNANYSEVVGNIYQNPEILK